MRSPSIEWLHAKIDKHIQLATSFTEVPELDFIIRACRLKPYDYIFDERTEKIVLYKWWFDEFGNSLVIKKYKRPEIILNDLRLDRDKIVCTDLYYGLSIDRVAKMSKLVHLVHGKDEDVYDDCCIISFLGIDEHLRSYLYWYGEWQQVSPLLVGLTGLKTIANHLDVRYYHQLGKKENSAIPCVSGAGWLSYLPASPAFVSDLNKQSEMLGTILKQ
jgi:hypothetical protein